MISVPVPLSVIKAGRKFGDEKHELRKNNKDKFIMGNEATVDREGFAVEFAHAYVYRSAYPETYYGTQVDEYDTLMACTKKQQILKIDIKASEKLLINKPQYERSKANAYLFEYIKWGDAQLDLQWLQIIGWIPHEDVPANSEVVIYPNKSVAYKVNRRALKKPDTLWGLTQPRSPKKKEESNAR